MIGRLRIAVPWGVAMCLGLIVLGLATFSFVDGAAPTLCMIIGVCFGILFWVGPGPGDNG